MKKTFTRVLLLRDMDNNMFYTGSFMEGLWSIDEADAKHFRNEPEVNVEFYIENNGIRVFDSVKRIEVVTVYIFEKKL